MAELAIRAGLQVKASLETLCPLRLTVAGHARSTTVPSTVEALSPLARLRRRTQAGFLKKIDFYKWILRLNFLPFMQELLA